MVIEEHNEFVEDNVSENEVEDSAEDEDIEDEITAEDLETVFLIRGQDIPYLWG